jgi:nitrogen fixation protein
MSDIIDINVQQTVEEVTINVVDNLITVNINKVTGGGGGTQTLAETLVLGNITDGENISISNGDAIVLDNGSMLKKGTIDAGNGGSGGISQICGVGFEHKWEAGRLYIMNSNGNVIREVSHNFTITPTATDDVTKGFVQDTRWILDNGDVYVCTDPTEGAAVWELQATQVNSDWNATSGVAEILNKPTIPDISNLVPYQLGGGLSKWINIYDESGNTGSLKLPDTITGDRLLLFQDKDYTGIADISDIPDTSTLVPYTGATQNVDLGEYELKSGQLTLDTTPTGTAAVATTRWNDTIGSSETTLKGGSVILKNGVDLVARVVNKVTPNTTLTKAAYQVVKISGAQGQRLAVNLAQANNDNNSADTLGIVTETIATNQEGFIITVGQLEGINTTGSLQSETWADGDVLYLSPTTAGAITNVKPTGATGHIVVLGYVEYAHANNGKIYVKIMNGWELDELHNVSITTPLDNQALTYETSTDLWKNKTIIEDSITNGVTDKAPSQNSVFDALALKQNVLSYTPYKYLNTTSVTHTGTTALTILATATINGGTFNSNDVMKILYRITKPSGTTGVDFILIHINTSNTLSGAVQVARLDTASAGQYYKMKRDFHLASGNLFGFNFNSSIANDDTSSNNQILSTSYNTANTLYLFFTIQLANAANSVTFQLANITN